MDEGNFEYSDRELRLKSGGTHRIFSVGDPRLRSYYDVTDKNELGAGGHPTYESIAEQAELLAEKLNAQLYP